jgi:hypothetical protein
LPVRHYDWIAHFARRTPDKPAVIDLASERRLSYRSSTPAFRAWPRICATASESRAATGSRCWR